MDQKTADSTGGPVLEPSKPGGVNPARTVATTTGNRTDRTAARTRCRRAADDDTNIGTPPTDPLTGMRPPGPGGPPDHACARHLDQEGEPTVLRRCMRPRRFADLASPGFPDRKFGAGARGLIMRHFGASEIAYRSWRQRRSVVGCPRRDTARHPVTNDSWRGGSPDCLTRPHHHAQYTLLHRGEPPVMSWRTPESAS